MQSVHPFPAYAVALREMISARRVAAALIVAAFVCVVASVSYRGWSLLNIPGTPDATHWVLQDFRDAVYYPAVALLHGDNPYDAARYRTAYPVWFPYPLYTPVNLILHLPLGLLPFRTAEGVYYLSMLVLTLLLARMSLRYCGLSTAAPAVCGFGTLILLSRPGGMNLLLGQVALQGVIATYVALLFGRTRPMLAGVGLAVSLFKPSFGVPLAVLMLCRGDRRAVATGSLLAGTVSLLMGGILAHAAGSVSALISSLHDAHRHFAVQPFNTPLIGPFRVDTAALFTRLLDLRGRAGELDVGIGILLVGAGAIWRLHRGTPATRARRELSGLLSCLTILMCVYHQAYDVLLLTLPLTVLVADQQPSRRSIRPLLRWVLLAALGVPAVNYLATATVLDSFGIDGPAWLIVTSLNAAALLLAWLVCVALAVWQAAALRSHVAAHQ